jgi:agmatine/peptidylarginine deiminase
MISCLKLSTKYFIMQKEKLDIQKKIRSQYLQKAKSSFKARFDLLLYKQLSNGITDEISVDMLDQFEIKNNLGIMDEYIGVFWQADNHVPIINGKTIEQIYEDMVSWKKINSAVIEELCKFYVDTIFQRVFPRDDFDKLILDNKKCHYCDITVDKINKLIVEKLIFKKHITRGWTFEIDRKVPNLEYTRDNCVISCYWCNNAKTDEFRYNEFKSIGATIRNVWENRTLPIKTRTLPDWHRCDEVAFVYPIKLEERAYLTSFYDDLFKSIPPGLKIKLLVKNLLYTSGLDQRFLDNGITNNVEFIEYADLTDIWIRDYAPLTTIAYNYPSSVKFKYSPSYIKEKDKKYIEGDDKVGESLAAIRAGWAPRLVDYTWDMGNLTHNGAGTAIITNRLIKDNEHVSLEELKSIIRIYLGFSDIIFIPVEPGDKTGHVDGMVRFIDEKVLAVGAYPAYTRNHSFMNRLATKLETDLGPDYTIIRLLNGKPEDHASEGIASAVGNHVNFLRINDIILFPYYSDPISKQPLDDFKNALQENHLNIKVVPVDTHEIIKLAKKGGVLNCISWQLFHVGHY